MRYVMPPIQLMRLEQVQKQLNRVLVLLDRTDRLIGDELFSVVQPGR